LTADFTRYDLADGVHLHVQPTAKFKTNIVYVYFHMPLASDTVTPDALLPMVLARGSASYPTTAQLARHLDELYGASFGFDVSRRGEVHSIVFTLEVAADQHIPGESGLLKRGLQTLTEIITRPALEGDGFKRSYFDQEAVNLKQTIESLVNDKRRLAMVRCTAEMCAGEPFELYRLGRTEDLAQITPQSLRAHHERVLRSAPVDIFVIGNVEPEEIRDLVCSTFTLPEAGPEGRRMPTTLVKGASGREPRLVEDRMDVNQGVLVIGLRTGLTLRDELYFPMLVANGVLGGFPHSKLFQQVREKHSLAYYAYSSLETVKGVGFMYAGIEFADRERCQEIMLQQLEAVQKGQITDEELETTIRTLANDMLAAADNPGAMADLAVDRVFSGRELSVEDRVRAFRQVTKEQVAEAARHFAVDTIYFLNRKEGGA